MYGLVPNLIFVIAVLLVLGVGVVRSTHGPGVYAGNPVLLVTADFAVRRCAAEPR